MSKIMTIFVEILGLDPKKKWFYRPDDISNKSLEVCTRKNGISLYSNGANFKIVFSKIFSSFFLSLTTREFSLTKIIREIWKDQILHVRNLAEDSITKEKLGEINLCWGKNSVIEIIIV